MIENVSAKTGDGAGFLVKGDANISVRNSDNSNQNNGSGTQEPMLEMLAFEKDHGFLRVSEICLHMAHFKGTFVRAK